MKSSAAAPADNDLPVSSTTANEPDILCFSHLRWHFVTQRPQHLLTRAANTRHVYYWEEPTWHHDENELPRRADGGLGMHLERTEVSPSLTVLEPHISWGIDFEDGQRTLLMEFLRSEKLERYVAWYYTPMALGFTSDLTPAATVYDCMDELSAFLGAPPELISREHDLISKADVMFTGGISLYEAKRAKHPNVHAFPSSIDVAHFAPKAAPASMEPEDQADIPHPRVGFYGVIDERFDVELLGAIAALRPNMQFIVLGPVVKIDETTLPQASNIHYLSGKRYDELPTYLAGWDAAMMPFALNESTRYISPTKTPEFLAAGKPVVSTAIRDVVRGYGDAGLVAIAAGAERFVEALDAALLPQSPSWHNTVRRKLEESSWDSTWTAMNTLLKQVQRPTGCSAEPCLADSAFEKHASVSYKPTPVLAAKRLEPMRLHVTVGAARSSKLKERFDYLVVGAGFAGSVLAERLASQSGHRVLVVDKRTHIGGNAYDFHNADGVLIHQYGPHIFHTNSEKVLAYLTQFTQWRPYEHRVLTSVDGKLVPMPINLETINTLYDLELDAAGMEAFMRARAELLPQVVTSEDHVVSKVGRELYEKFFRNYTRKQWGLDPSQLDAAVAARIPFRLDADDRYFTDEYQVMPLEGYTRMFERMLDHPLITVRTGVDYKDIARSYPNVKIIYTGPVDEFFDFRYGPLPYRSLEFRHETHDQAIFQPAAVVNYPNEHDYTRVTEFKYLTGQKHRKTSIVYEYPRAEGDPYYPIPRPENAALYARYKELADRTVDVHFCGRLANYKYLNMDQVVGQALATYKRIAARQEITLPQLAMSAEGLSQSTSA